MYLFKRLWYKVKNLIRWLPIIWNDEDWDHYYILNIWIAKLKFTRQFYLDGKSVVIQHDVDKIIKEISLVIKILEHINMTDEINHFRLKNWYSEKENEPLQLDYTTAWEIPPDGVFEDQFKFEEAWNRLNWKRFHDLVSSRLDTWWD